MAGNIDSLKSHAIIPARRGSKRLPGKNMRELAGKPLIQWTIEAAQQSRAIGTVIVTSDDPAVLSLALELGVDAVIDRPFELATDTAKTSAVIMHAIHFIKAQGVHPNTLCLLQATSPLRTANDIDDAHDLYVASKAPAVISVCQLDHPIAWCGALDESLSMRDFAEKIREEKLSQDHEKHYRLNGAIYIARYDAFIRMNGFLSNETLAYIMSREHSIDIDEEMDFKLSQLMLDKYA
ncbi:acylneuraminate cytidylyltransferase family protein [Halomonas sp. DQ26W]|uniref:acylneuraminate cytidylyltransferase family protein n=1 Tax=Halomonas sp. DQ26W TaxID=2282311 RepID=UPI000DF760D4|nr:acylneuraminate cytidylyltransferase family protein [Halomonas sp. DQ26W]RDB42162.1 acylneuraminate cytidylyltransferase family protein [Halomonas sp. DQ26W]